MYIPTSSLPGGQLWDLSVVCLLLLPSWRDPSCPQERPALHIPDVASFPPEPGPCPLVMPPGSAAIETVCSSLELSVSWSGPGMVVIISPGGFEGHKPGWKSNLPPPKIKSKGCLFQEHWRDRHLSVLYHLGAGTILKDCLKRILSETTRAGNAECRNEWMSIDPRISLHIAAASRLTTRKAWQHLGLWGRSKLFEQGSHDSQSKQ